MAITKNRDVVRLEIGDTDTGNYLFTDEELDVFLRRYGLTGTKTDGGDTLLSVAANALESLANRFSRDFDFAEDGQSFSLSQRAASYRARATELRRRSGGYSVKVISSVNTAIEDF